MKKLSVFLFLMLLTSSIYGKPKFIITEQTSNSITLSLELDSINEKTIIGEGEKYELLQIEGFGYNGKSGAPVLPSRILSLITSLNPDISFEILESEIEIRKNYNIYPLQESFFNYMENDDLSNVDFVKNTEAYRSNDYFPKNPIIHNKTSVMRGVPLSFISINPIQFNSAKKEVKVYRKLKVKISYTPLSQNRMSSLNSASIKFLNNKSLNLPKNLRQDVNTFEDYGDDILILTVPKFLAAAEKLSVWQKMKGYDVKIDSRDSWDETSITDVCHSFYKNTSPKPGYIIPFGDHEDVPTQIVHGTGLGEEKIVHTDLYYTCTDGPKDNLPEMATGRISADNADEAMMIVDKLIKYEKNPPTKSSFYNNHFGCAYYQDHGNGNGENVADRAFVYYVEEVRKYLDENHDKTGNRLYWTKASTAVVNWNDDPFAFGGEVPKDLQRPQYSWSLEKSDIANAFNDGVFLACYSDHGNSIGWGYSPSYFAFYQPDLNSMVNNGELLPIVLNIACSVGQIKGGDSFAEDLLSHPNGGAVGNVAASIYSWSGYNEALFLGMIDAIWPSEKMDLSTPHMPDPEISTRHDPIYTMGDVMLQGKFRMTETWHWQEDGDIAHYEMYHYFGDPTTRIWTEEPQEITVSTDLGDVIANSASYKISGLSIDTGFATLYNSVTGKVIGKANIKDGAAELKLQKDIGSHGDAVVLTVRSQNFRPLIKDINVSGETAINNILKYAGVNFKVINNKIRIDKSIAQKGTLSIIDLKGKAVRKVDLGSSVSTKYYDFNKSNLSKGVYIVSVKIGLKVYKFSFCYK